MANKTVIIPNTLRFIEKPHLNATYFYIGDIDLFIFEDLLNIHLQLISKNQLPFSNIIRLDSLKTPYPRLTGLHFCAFDTYFPLPDLSDLALDSLNDEHVLFKLMEKKGIMVPKSFQERPTCGVHASLNRDPIGRTSGCFNSNFTQDGKSFSWLSTKYAPLYLSQIQEENYCLLYRSLNIETKSILLTLEAAFTNKSRALHRRALAHSIDKRLLEERKSISIAELKKEREKLILEKRFVEVVALGQKSLVLWPFNIDLWHQQAWAFLATNNYEMAAECYLHILDLPKGKEFIIKNGFIERLNNLVIKLQNPLKNEMETEIKLLKSI